MRRHRRAPRGARGPHLPRLTRDRAHRWHSELLMRRMDRLTDPRDIDLFLSRTLRTII